MKQITIKSIGVIFLIFCYNHLFAQKYSYDDVPALTIEDFRDAPEQKPHKYATAFTSCNVFYDVKNKKNINNNSIQITYSTRVIMRKDISWLDKQI